MLSGVKGHTVRVGVRVCARREGADKSVSGLRACVLACMCGLCVCERKCECVCG
jgi:hypothetical protein